MRRIVCLRFPRSYVAQSIFTSVRDDSLLRMLHGYMDESYRDAPDTSPVYVVAGYLADPSSWVEFEARWMESMRRLEIDQIGLHASDCERGRKDYSGMSEEKRREIVRGMVSDINASGLRGVIAAIDNTALRKWEKNIKAFWIQPAKKYHRPHIYAADMCVSSMFLATEGSNEPISFFADQNKEFEARCQEWYVYRSCEISNPFHHRYGSYTAADRRKFVALQAADLLAYSAFRNLTGDDGWCWSEMTSGIPLARAVAGDEFWRNISSGIDDG